jgi:hypothetical protein
MSSDNFPSYTIPYISTNLLKTAKEYIEGQTGTPSFDFRSYVRFVDFACGSSGGRKN